MLKFCTSIFTSTESRFSIRIFAALSLCLLFSGISNADINPLPRGVRVLLFETNKPVQIITSLKTSKLSRTSFLPALFQSSDSVVYVNGRPYRGTIVVERNKTNQHLRVINELLLDEYIMGVLPREMPVSWDLEALKAQAVAARTYAVNAVNKTAARNKSGFDLKSTIADQVYGGYAAESDSSNLAVRNTAGQVLLYNQTPIQSFFHSTCGGTSEKPANVWGPKPAFPEWMDANENVFKIIQDTYCQASPVYEWVLVQSRRDFQKRLKKATGIRRLSDIAASPKNKSGRIKSIRVSGSSGIMKKKVHSLSGQEFRMAAGPSTIKSLRFEMEEENGRYYFSGFGWGHGVGLCQWGARGRANAGFTYAEILKSYYPGAELVQLATQTHMKEIHFNSSKQFIADMPTDVPVVKFPAFAEASAGKPEDK